MVSDDISSPKPEKIEWHSQYQIFKSLSLSKYYFEEVCSPFKNKEGNYVYTTRIRSRR